MSGVQCSEMHADIASTMGVGRGYAIVRGERARKYAMSNITLRGIRVRRADSFPEQSVHGVGRRNDRARIGEEPASTTRWALVS
jgi:hypothetical protein